MNNFKKYYEQQLIEAKMLNSNNAYKCIIELSKIVQDAGFNLYIIGGAVRDELLGLTPQDYDLTTDMPANDFLKLLDNGKIVERKDKTLVIGTFKGEEFETSCGLDIIQQLLQGDLTINSMAKNVLTNEIIDPTNGQNDLNSKILRYTDYSLKEVNSGIGNLKMGRLLRFIAQYHWNIDRATIDAFKTCVKLKQKAHKPIWILKKVKEKIKQLPYKDAAVNFGLNSDIPKDVFRGIL